MIKFTKNIENKYVTLLLVAIVIVLVFVVYTKSNFISNSALYRLNSDCAKQAQSFAKGKNSNPVSWEVLQSGFNKSKNSCFAEFDSGGGITLIYDLTHSKELALYSANAGQLAHKLLDRKYEDIKINIFGK